MGLPRKKRKQKGKEKERKTKVVVPPLPLQTLPSAVEEGSFYVQYDERVLFVVAVVRERLVESRGLALSDEITRAYAEKRVG